MPVKKSGTVRVRMLAEWPVEGVVYKCNQVVNFPEKLAKSLESNNKADSNEEAVSYALQFTKAVKHQLPDVQEQKEGEG